jgi:chromosome segregation ATPase
VVVTGERDRFESELRDARSGEETTSRRAPVVDPEATHQADVSRYTALVARATELERKMVTMEKDDEKLRRQLGEAQAQIERLRASPPPKRPTDDDKTSVREAVPSKFSEQLGVLEEAIDSLRANMRAASDETAMMEQTDSVAAVASAVSQAAEHVERARDAVKTIVAYVNGR